MSLRLQRVSELLKRELGEILRRELSIEEAGLISVNEVEVTSDLQHANVYVTVLGSAAQKKQALSLLQQNRKRFQGQIGQAIVLKYTPQLRFVMDESIERGNRILDIIDDIEKSSPQS